MRGTNETIVRIPVVLKPVEIEDPALAVPVEVRDVEVAIRVPLYCRIPSAPLSFEGIISDLGTVSYVGSKIRQYPAPSSFVF